MNIILYAIIEAICALVVAILLMSHLHDKRNAYRRPLTEHAVLAIGLTNFVVWVAVAALSFFAIVGHYQRVEVPIQEQDISEIRPDADGEHADVTVRDRTYKNVDKVSIAKRNDPTGRWLNRVGTDIDTVCVKAWFTDDVSAEQMSESVSEWIESGRIDGNMIVLTMP